MSREAFVARFSEHDADRLQAAAESHRNGVHDEPGADPFRWAVLIALGHECVSKAAYREYHGLTLPWLDFDAWLKEPTQRQWLAKHRGDVDYLAMMAGVYDDYMPEKHETVG